MKFATLLALLFSVVFVGCTSPVSPTTSGPKRLKDGSRLGELKSEPTLQSESVVDGQVKWKWDREYTRDIQLRNSRNGFGKDVWYEYILEVRMVVGDHDEKVDLRVSEEVFGSIKEFDGVKVRRSLYSDGSRSYELVVDK